MPVVAPIVTIAALLEDQAPAGVVLDNVAVFPKHSTLVPEMAAGMVLTVATLVTEQPAADVYVILTVPAATPVTAPPVPTVAVALFALLHAPPKVASASVVLLPSQTDAVPVIAPGNATMV